MRGLGKGDIQTASVGLSIRTDSIAAWVNEWVILTHLPRLIGSDRSEWNDTAYDQTPYLFALQPLLPKH
jgi:putative DNA primase/helicase